MDGEIGLEDIEDPTNLTGLSALINTKHTDIKLDLNEIEKNMIGDVGIRVIAESDPAREFANTIRELSADTGINLDGFSEEPVDDYKNYKRAAAAARPRAPQSREDVDFAQTIESPTDDANYELDPREDFAMDEYPDNGESEPPAPSNPPAKTRSRWPSANDDFTADKIADKYDQSYANRIRNPRNEYADYDSYNDSYNDYDQLPPPQQQSQQRPNRTPQPNYYERRQDYYSQPYFNRPSHSEVRDDHGRHLDDALQAYSGGNGNQINMDREREEDMKAILLEDIDELMAELEADNVDLSRVPKVNADSSFQTVKDVHKLLRMKYDRRRCNTLGSEIILAGAQGLGYFCDGQRKIGPFRPNLSGWHNTVRSKLHRMKYETSTIVAGIMQEYNIGPAMRVALELVPSAFLYSNMRSEQQGKKNYTPDQMSEAYNDLRQYE